MFIKKLEVFLNKFVLLVKVVPEAFSVSNVVWCEFKYSLLPLLPLVFFVGGLGLFANFTFGRP